MRTVRTGSVIISSRSILAFFLLGALGYIAYDARWIIVGLLLGIGIGTLLCPAVDTLHDRLRLPRGAGALICLVLIVAFLCVVAYILYRLLAGQAGRLSNSLPAMLEMARVRALALSGRFPWLNLRLNRLGSERLLPNLAGWLLQGLQKGATVLTGVLFILATALYTAAAPKAYIAGLLSALPAHKRPHLALVFAHAARDLRRWFFAQLLALCTIGFLTGSSLFLAHVPYAAIFGLLTGILDVVPYVGPVMAFFVVTTVTLGAQPALVPWVIGIFIGIQQIEGNVVVPLVMKGRVELPPVPLIALMLVMGQEFGVVGVLMATPILCVSRTLYLDTWVRRMDQDGSQEPQLPPGARNSLDDVA